MKTCSRCKAEKPISEFFAHKQKKDGLGYWCKACQYEKRNAWGKKNKEKLAEKAKEWRAANKEWCYEYRKKWAAENPEKVRQSVYKWRKSNPEICGTLMQNRRARERAIDGVLSVDLVKRLFKLQRGKCACGCKQPLGSDFHRDHIMPLALGGTNEDSNIQLLTAKCNLQKSAKHPVDFMQQRGFLI